MKKARLDQILLRMNVVTEEQIRQALLRQKSRGGKLGTHLLYYRYVTEEQLVNALSEQFSVVGVRLSDCEIPADVVRRIPAQVAEAHVALPFRFDPEKGELHVAIADPEDTNALSLIRRASGTPRIIVHIAPEIGIRDKIAFHYHGRVPSPVTHQVIDLPDLFGEETDPRSGPAAESARNGAGAEARINVLLFTGQVFLKNVLPSVFEREGLHLSVSTSTGEIAASLKTMHCQRVLVSEDVQEDFRKFVAESKSSASFPEVTYFRTVAGSLLENPVPYDKMYECLLTAVRHIVGRRASETSSATPYALISKDIADVGRSVGLDRIAVDGLRIAAHLLVPPASPPDDASVPGDPQDMAIYGDLDASMKVAQSLDFPWDVAAGIRLLKTMIADSDWQSVLAEEKKPLAMAAGVLALVWYRHHALRPFRGGSRGDLELLKSRLRRQAARLAPSAAVEAYVRLLEQSDATAGADKDIFVVGDVDPLLSKLILELKHHGFRIVETGNLQDARQIYSRRRPAAILIHVDASLTAADAFCRSLREDAGDAGTVLFAVTQRSEPSFLLNLMDTWYSDVFPLPVNSQVAVARISKALSGRDKGAGGPVGQGFSATFKDLSFVDLVQALGTGAKNVRMRIENSNGRHADIHFRQGRIVHAICGNEKGVEAVYQVIRWQDDGSFRIEPAGTFPADNVAVPTDYILLEGSRLLDEGRR